MLRRTKSRPAGSSIQFRLLKLLLGAAVKTSRSKLKAVTVFLVSEMSTMLKLGGDLRRRFDRVPADMAR